MPLARRPRATISALAALAALSFALGAWGTVHSPVSAFYLLPGRAWELLAGGLLACLPIRIARARVADAAVGERPRRHRARHDLLYRRHALPRRRRPSALPRRPAGDRRGERRRAGLGAARRGAAGLARAHLLFALPVALARDRAGALRGRPGPVPRDAPVPPRRHRGAGRPVPCRHRAALHRQGRPAAAARPAARRRRRRAGGPPARAGARPHRKGGPAARRPAARCRDAGRGSFRPAGGRVPGSGAGGRPPCPTRAASARPEPSPVWRCGATATPACGCRPCRRTRNGGARPAWR